MTTVSAVMFEIVEMYIFQIHLHYFFLTCGKIFSKKSLVHKFWNKLKNKINHGFALTYNTLKKNNANEFEIYTFQRFQTFQNLYSSHFFEKIFPVFVD
jgi:hypothetical protein